MLTILNHKLIITTDHENPYGGTENNLICIWIRKEHFSNSDLDFLQNLKALEEKNMS